MSTNIYCHTCHRTTDHTISVQEVACRECGRTQEWADWWLEEHSELMDAMQELEKDEDARRCAGCHGCVTPCDVRLGKK